MWQMCTQLIPVKEMMGYITTRSQVHRPSIKNLFFSGRWSAVKCVLRICKSLGSIPPLLRSFLVHSASFQKLRPTELGVHVGCDIGQQCLKGILSNAR